LRSIALRFKGEIIVGVIYDSDARRDVSAQKEKSALERQHFA